MPKIIPPLTSKQVSQTKPKDKTYEISDGGGLMLRVTPSGKKSWLLKYYKPHSKKRSNLALGNFPDISLAVAREKKDEAKALISEDIDPHHIRTSKQENSLEQVSLQWLLIKQSKVSKDFAQDILRSLELHIFPQLGSVPINQITAPSVIDTLKPVETKGSHETVKRLCQRINEVMVYATNTGIIHSNPLAGIKAAFLSHSAQNLPTLKPEQIPMLLKAIHRANIRITTRQLILWQLHTMTRPSETSGAKWSEIDIDKKLWTIPAYRMKKKREHLIPLTPQSIEIIEVMRPISCNSEFLFPADRDKNKPANSSTANMALKRMGYKNQLVAHGLRSLASTVLNNHGFDADIIESALAHIDKNQTRSAYNRAEYLERRRIMMTWWSTHIEEALIDSLSTNNQRLSLISQ